MKILAIEVQRKTNVSKKKIVISLFCQGCSATTTASTSTGECSEGEFLCTIGGPGAVDCVPGGWQCDGMDDCDGGEDEYGEYGR